MNYFVYLLVCLINGILCGIFIPTLALAMGASAIGWALITFVWLLIKEPQG